MGDVLVVVLSCACVDIDYARRNLSCLRVLEVRKVQRRNIAISVYIYHAACLAFAEELICTHCELCAVCEVIGNRVLATYIVSYLYRTALNLEVQLLELLLEQVVEEHCL